MSWSWIFIGQDFSQGFQLLEKGNFKEAATYFEQARAAYPNNLTAKVCYGRAIGLSGKAEEANTLFETLYLKLPDNQEIALNYAESLLWTAQPDKALTVYKKLLDKQPELFTALLGQANAQASDQQYELALSSIEKAIRLAPENTNALTSLKFIRLGLANQYKFEGKIGKARALLQQNLQQFPADSHVLNSWADLEIGQGNYEKAEGFYRQLTHPIEALLGQSLALHLQKKNKTALQYAQEAHAHATASSDRTWIQKAQQRLVQAMLWNKKYKQARKAIDTATNQGLGIQEIRPLEASWAMYTGQIRTAISCYEKILIDDVQSFDGNLGIANAYFALGDLESALNYAHRTLKFFPNQKDAKGLIKKIEQQQTPVLSSAASIAEDNGDNRAEQLSLNVQLPVSNRFSMKAGFSRRKTENKITQDSAVQSTFAVGASYQIHNKTRILADLGVISTNGNQQQYKGLQGGVYLEAAPLSRQYLKVGVSRSLQNFNAALLNEALYMNSLVINHNITTAKGLGWYTGYDFTSQSDENTRHNLFTSVYGNLFPSLKVGGNYQYLSFKNQEPLRYFSPAQYHSAELFASFNHSTKKWKFNLDAAIGKQWIESQAAMNVLRIQGGIDYTFSPQFQLGVFGQYSNSASATATGFEIQEIGIRLRWNFLKQPVYRLQ